MQKWSYFYFSTKVNFSSIGCRLFFQNIGSCQFGLIFLHIHSYHNEFLTALYSNCHEIFLQWLTFFLVCFYSRVFNIGWFCTYVFFATFVPDFRLKIEKLTCPLWLAKWALWTMSSTDQAEALKKSSMMWNISSKWMRHLVLSWWPNRLLQQQAMPVQGVNRQSR